MRLIRVGFFDCVDKKRWCSFQNFIHVENWSPMLSMFQPWKSLSFCMGHWRYLTQSLCIVWRENFCQTPQSTGSENTIFKHVVREKLGHGAMTMKMMMVMRNGAYHHCTWWDNLLKICRPPLRSCGSVLNLPPALFACCVTSFLGAACCDLAKLP